MSVSAILFLIILAVALAYLIACAIAGKGRNLGEKL